MRAWSANVKTNERVKSRRRIAIRHQFFVVGSCLLRKRMREGLFFFLPRKSVTMLPETRFFKTRSRQDRIARLPRPRFFSVTHSSSSSCINATLVGKRSSSTLLPVIYDYHTLQRWFTAAATVSLKYVRYRSIQVYIHVCTATLKKDDDRVLSPSPSESPEMSNRMHFR